MEQWLFGRSLSTTQAFSSDQIVQSGAVWWTNTITYDRIIPAYGWLSDFTVDLSAAPGAGASHTFILTKNGSYTDRDTTDLSVTISDAATSGSDSSHQVAVSPGDIIRLKDNIANAPAAAVVYWRMKFTSRDTKQSLILTAAHGVSGATYYIPMNGGATTANFWTEGLATSVCPTNGTVKNLYIWAWGTVGDSWRLVFRVNGADTALTKTITMSASTEIFSVSADVSIAPGDIVSVAIQPQGVPAMNIALAVGMTFEAAIDGESIIWGGTWDEPSVAGIEYFGLNESDGSLWNAALANVEQAGFTATLRKLYVKLIIAPGGGAAYGLDIMLNNIPYLPISIVGAATTGNNTGSVSATGQRLAIRCTPVGPPALTDAYWGLVQYNTPPLPPAPVAAFTAIPTSGAPPLAVQFTNGSTGDITGYSWDFGDLSPLDTNTHPNHIYAGAGTYTVTLTVTGLGGVSTATLLIYVSTTPVVPTPPSPVAEPTPTVTVNAATAITEQTARLNGIITQSLGTIGQVRFEYGLSASYGSVTAWIGGYVEGIAFSASIAGLASGQAYHYRAVFQNSNGTYYSAGATFSTPSTPIGLGLLISGQEVMYLGGV